MRLTDPKWPAVRECSRQILREEGIQLISPLEFEKEQINLLRMMSDKLPARLDFPKLLFHESDIISVRHQHEGEWKEIIHVGLVEPPADILWIPLNAAEGWPTILAVLTELLDAGYPGCLGCGGPESEQPWDEAESRLRFAL